MTEARYRPSLGSVLHSMDGAEHGNSSTSVSDKANHYLSYFNNNNSCQQDDENVAMKRKENAVDVSNNYYDLATDFYEYGWGEGFHFAALSKGESRDHSFSKYEYKLALRLHVDPTDTVLDVGCGIGGPARSIASFSGCRVVGINCNEYQLKRAATITKEKELQHLCSFRNEDFHGLSFGDGTFDKAYAIEATCHARDLLQVYKEIYRVLRPGGRFAAYEWIMTDKYNPTDPYHNKLKHDILEGDGLHDVITRKGLHDVIRQSGFELLEAEDQANLSVPAWYSILEARYTLSDLRSTALGRWFTHIMLMGLETLGLAPQGSVKVHRMLCKGADGLRIAGREGIFSPMYLIVLKKPKK